MSKPKEGEDKIMFLGCGGVGKSAIILKYMYQEFFEDYEPTKADSYRKPIEVDGEVTNVDILDTAGQEDYAAIRDGHIRSSEGFVCVFSVCDMTSFEQMSDFIENIYRVKGYQDKIPGALVGNKIDLANSRVVTREQAVEKAQQWKIPYYEVSAKTGENVPLVFTNVVRDVRLIKGVQNNTKVSAQKKSKSKKCSVL